MGTVVVTTFLLDFYFLTLRVGGTRASRAMVAGTVVTVSSRDRSGSGGGFVRYSPYLGLFKGRLPLFWT